MKAFIVRLFVIFFILSFTSMFFWHHFTHSAATYSYLQTVKVNNATREHKPVHRNNTHNAGIQKGEQKVEKRVASDVQNQNPATSAAAFRNLRTVTKNKITRELKTVHRDSQQITVLQKDKQKDKKSDTAANDRQKGILNPAKTDAATYSYLQTVKVNNATREHKPVHRNNTHNAGIQKGEQKVEKRVASDVQNQNPATSAAAFRNLRTVTKKKITRELKTVHRDSQQITVLQKDKQKDKKSDTAANDRQKGILNPAKTDNTAASDLHKVAQNSSDSKEIATVKTLMVNYTYNWKKQEKNFNYFRSMLNSSCNAISTALVTQDNSPVGTNITYDADGRKTIVKPALYNIFPKESPFKKAPWDSCAVIGNGGILANSSCGKQIDSASFVIRCNLPPLSNGHEKDTGSKTSIVTANPSIITQRYQSLVERRRPFVEDMQLYGDALITLPAFSYAQNTALSLRTFYALEEFNSSGPRAVFFNPVYLKSLSKFWRERGIRAGRLSSGIMMTSLALEVCNNVHLYGFWPFETHPYTYQLLNNHYYDDKLPKKVHNMPAEFKALLNLHNEGVIHLHLEKCTN